MNDRLASRICTKCINQRTFNVPKAEKCRWISRRFRANGKKKTSFNRIITAAVHLLMGTIIIYNTPKSYGFFAMFIRSNTQAYTYGIFCNGRRGYEKPTSTTTQTKAIIVRKSYFFSYRSSFSSNLPIKSTRVLTRLRVNNTNLIRPFGSKWRKKNKFYCSG